MKAWVDGTWLKEPPVGRLNFNVSAIYVASSFQLSRDGACKGCKEWCQLGKITKKKTIIAGSRSIWSYAEVEQAVIESGFSISEVICGMAPGVDSVGWAWAYVNRVPIVECPADWQQWGKSAGFRRNMEMSEKGQALIALWDGVSPGTASMIYLAQRRRLRVHVRIIRPSGQMDLV